MISARMAAVPGLMRREYSAAKIAWSGILLLQVIGLGVAMRDLHGGNAWAVVVVGAGLAIRVASEVLRARASRYQANGEGLRKALLLADGWGRDLDPEVALLGVAEGTSLPSWDAQPIDSYFNSSRPPGPHRVAHILQQSAFFTARHSALTAWLGSAVAIASGVMGLVLLWLVANGFAAAESLPNAAQAASALLAFSVGSEFLGIGLAFGRLARVARETVQRCGRLVAREEPDVGELALAISAYDCALVQAPPLPGMIYKLQRPRLEQAWREFQGLAN